MGLFDFYKNKKIGELRDKYFTPDNIDMSNWKGKDFEFLITGDINIKNDEFDDIMTPTSLEWIKVEKDNWIYYKVGNDDFSYSIEEPGIQMVFNQDISFNKAKVIADEIMDNLKAKGQEAELVIINSNNVYKF